MNEKALAKVVGAICLTATVVVFLFTQFETKGDAVAGASAVEQRLIRIEGKLDQFLVDQAKR